MKKRVKWTLLSLFIIVVIIRIILAFLTPGFTYESYFHLRQVDHITKTGFLNYNDDLSYGGRTLIFLPFFHYFMAFFSLFLPLTIVAKILPNILMASITLTTYHISHSITNDENSSLLSAFIVGFLPILFSTNSFTVETLFLPITFFIIYVFMNIKRNTNNSFGKSNSLWLTIKRKKYLYLYIISFLILSLTSTLTFLLIIGFGIYMLLSLMENKKINKEELEIIIFSLFFFLWVQFIFYKNSLLQEGFSFFWQNVPSGIITEYFPKVSIIEALVLVSTIPFLTGIFVAYRSLFKLKNKKSFLLISFVISTTLLAWLRLIRFKQSLAFFGIILGILFAPFYLEMEKYFQKTKLFKFKEFILPITIILLLLSTTIPAINASLKQDTPTEEEIGAFKWLNENTPTDSKILGTLEEGHLITYYSKRKNIMDNQFRLIDDVDKRLKDINSLFTTHFQTQVLSLSEDYNLKYLVLTPSAKKKYNITEFNYLSKQCFGLIYDKETKIYEVKCELK